ncbi:roundabout homolog 2-like [Diaphorina citri]|uniref:Roundabout homolog 2-like n=1 Tax=Diaphorina citri TaxID=121845 RepID=A0A3Q0J7Q4_DIACI|nr:roundabout homolog 2-like [Diaphorina citri]
MVLREEFRVQPKSQRVAAGDTALLECGPPRGHPEPTLVWKKNGHPIDFENSKRLRLVDGTNLAIQDSRKTDDGRYQCVVKNVAGTRESTDAVLRVLVKPYIIRGPKDTTVSAGSIIVFECSVGGDAVLTVHWKRLGSAMPEDRMSVLPSRSLQLSDVRLEDGGEYVCEAENAVGKISASATLTVQMAPIVRERPSDLRLEVGRDAVASNWMVEGNRSLIYPGDRVDNIQAEITSDGMNLLKIQGNRSLIYPGDRVDNIQAEITSDGMNLLKIQNVSRTAAPLIILCLGVNAAGSDLMCLLRGFIALLTSMVAVMALLFLAMFLYSGPANQTLPLRSEARLRCQVRGEGSVQWWRGEREVGSGPRVNVTGDGSLVLTASASWSASLRFESPTNPNIGFFRAPEPSTYPGPPTKPTLVNQTANGLTLAWSRNNQIGSSSLLGYQVEMYSRPLPSSSPSGDTATATWVRVATNVPSPILTVTNLTVGLTYTFLVRALNSHGLSAPSPLSDEIVEMYSRPLPSSSPSGDTATATWVRVATNVPSPILTLTNLTTGLTYTFLVRALNSHGLSAPSPLSDEIVLRGTFSEGIFSEGGKGIFSENFPDEGRGESLRRARQHLQEGGGSLIELTEVKPMTSTSVKLTWEVSWTCKC